MFENPTLLTGGDAAPLARDRLQSDTHHVVDVSWVRHWTDQYFSFGVTRPASFRFRSGEFVMIGLPGANGGKPILRAYSIASPAWADELEFFSIKVPDGPLTSRLQKVVPGDQILMAKKPTGTLVTDALRPGKRLWLLGTGTGLAPWLSVARDPDVYDAFGNLVVVHCVRRAGDLAYRDLFERELPNDEIFGELARDQLVYMPTVTRDAFTRMGRITDLIESGRLFADAGLAQTCFDPAEDRVMLCGSMGMIKDVAQMLKAQGLKEGSNADPGDFVLERAFVG
ncbi:MAG TPA: ferredoxin--NADP reductase [Caulobacteraceae bacterium]|jgi:ferredoxin--NADP+ reductase